VQCAIEWFCLIKNDLLVHISLFGFLADRTNGRAIATLLRLLSVCDVMYCG